MKDKLMIVYDALRKTFENKVYYFIFLGLFVVMSALFTLIPALVVPGNSTANQIEIFTARDYLVIAILSALYALFVSIVSMQIFSFKNRKNISDVGGAVGGGIGALFAGVAGTAFCVSCLAPMFAFFGIGFGGVIFVLEYRFYFVAGIVILMIMSIYLTSRKIQRACDKCV